jgi:hypothetical protein
VPEATGLSDEQMQQIARRLRLFSQVSRLDLEVSGAKTAPDL